MKAPFLSHPVRECGSVRSGGSYQRGHQSSDTAVAASAAHSNVLICRLVPDPPFLSASHSQPAGSCISSAVRYQWGGVLLASSTYLAGSLSTATGCASQDYLSTP